MRFAMVAGEESGDYLGAELIAALRKRYPEAEFVGIGGERMQAAGMRVLYPMQTISIVGLDDLLGNIAKILSIRKHLADTFLSEPPHAFIGIDVPDFNLSLEAKLRRRDIPVVHYVSPTVWAWRGYRIKKIKRAVDHMLALFPFETAFYERHGVPATFVGHPVAEEIESEQTTTAARRALALPFEDGSVVALLPGSRRSEVRRHARLFVDTCNRLLQRDRQLRFVIAFASESCEQTFDAFAGEHELPLHRVHGRSRDVMSAADVVLLASGTATLEAALLRRPMVVTYKVSLTTEVMVRCLGSVDHYAMPNHLMASPLVPEFMQRAATADNLCAALMSYLTDPAKVEALKVAFADLHERLRGGGSDAAADAIAGVLHREAHA